MTRTERERLVEQYLEGSMDFAQEENFFIQVALDDELRRTLKSYRIVDEAIRKERDAGTREHAAARYVVAGMLTATPQPAEAAASGFQGKLANLLKRQVSRRIATAAAATGLVLFGWMGVQQIYNGQQETAGTSAVTPGSENIKAEQQQGQEELLIQEKPAQRQQVAVSGGETTLPADRPATVREQTAENKEEGAAEASRNLTPTPPPATVPVSQTPPPAVNSASKNALHLLRFDSTQKSSSQPDHIELPVDVDPAWGPKE